jgi:hypothetical protein
MYLDPILDFKGSHSRMTDTAIPTLDIAGSSPVFRSMESLTCKPHPNRSASTKLVCEAPRLYSALELRGDQDVDCDISDFSCSVFQNCSKSLSATAKRGFTLSESRSPELR